MLSDEELAGIREKARRWRNAPCQTTIEMCDEISRLRAEVARLEAGRLKPETVAVIQAHLSHAAPMLRSAAAALDDLSRCYPPEEV